MFSLEQILEWSGGRLVDAGAAAPTSVGVARMAPLRGSGPRDVCFFFSKDYQHELAEARPGILVTGEPFVEPLPGDELDAIVCRVTARLPQLDIRPFYGQS